jgi:hypothetical protein
VSYDGILLIQDTIQGIRAVCSGFTGTNSGNGKVYLLEYFKNFYLIS